MKRVSDPQIHREKSVIDLRDPVSNSNFRNVAHTIDWLWSTLLSQIFRQTVKTSLRRNVNILVDQTALTGKCTDSYIPQLIVILLRSIMSYDSPSRCPEHLSIDHLLETETMTKYSRALSQVPFSHSTPWWSKVLLIHLSELLDAKQGLYYGQP